jgi:putative DNA primase/helicase
MFPAMVAAITDIASDLIGTHATFLRGDGTGKADFPRSELQRECRGVVRGGAIRLAPHDPGRELIIAEGIETTLSAMQIFALSGWSAVYAGGLKTVELPATVHRIVITADNDISGTGQRNAVAAARRWKAEGRAVRIVLPTVTGDDFNTVLSRRRGNG